MEITDAIFPFHDDESNINRHEPYFSVSVFLPLLNEKYNLKDFGNNILDFEF